MLCVFVFVFNVHADMTYVAHNGQLKTVVLMGQGKQVGQSTTDRIYSMGDKQFGSAWNIEFSGIMNLENTGQVELVLSSDDGSALYIDDKAVIMLDGLHGNSTRKNTVTLAQGQHQVNLLYFNNNGNHALSCTLKVENGTPQDLASVCFAQ